LSDAIEDLAGGVKIQNESLRELSGIPFLT